MCVTLSKIKRKMSREKTNKQKQISILGEIAKKCKTDDQKIDFFNSYKEAFFIDSKESNFSVKDNMTKDLDDAFYIYANMKRLNETELEELKIMSWNEYPKNFKIFLFDYCIINGQKYLRYFLD